MAMICMTQKQLDGLVACRDAAVEKLNLQIEDVSNGNNTPTDYFLLVIKTINEELRAGIEIK
jgi:hypothetical protein